MSNTTTVAVASIAATLAAVQPAAAANGVSEKRVRAIVKQEVAKIPRGPRGPAGPRGTMGAPGPAGAQGAQGPAGMDGFQFLFAHVDPEGSPSGPVVDPNRSSGITRENVREEVEVLEGAQSPDPQGAPVITTTYCFIGLPPVIGGQVTMDGVGGFAAVVSPKLEINPADDGCPVRVSIHGFEQFPDDHREPPIAASFYILLY
jgi:hypothetical protein